MTSSNDIHFRRLLLRKRQPLSGRKTMNDLSDEERKKILESSPVGTWALMLIVSSGMVIAWLLMYYGVFLPRGPIG